MKLSFGVGLLAALTGMALAAPADSVAQNQRRNVDVSQGSATHRLDSQKLSHSMAMHTENEKREISEQQGKPKSSGLLNGLLSGLLGNGKGPKNPKKPKKPSNPTKDAEKEKKEKEDAKKKEDDKKKDDDKKKKEEEEKKKKEEEKKPSDKPAEQKPAPPASPAEKPKAR